MFRAIHEKFGNKVVKDDVIGGAIVENDDGTWTFNLNSTTLNFDKYGVRHADGRNMRPCKDLLEDGDYYTVSVAGSINKGTHKFVISKYD